jgi:hypothetical protein
MAFSPKDTKLLWGRAAGLCSNPSCRKKLTAVGAGRESFLTGEMAHQIAQSKKGPRGSANPGADTYDNLILLCPTCHRTIDKAPDGTYPIEQLNDWKRDHEAWVDSWPTAEEFDTPQEMAAAILELLGENRMHFEEYGPRSELAQRNPGSSAHAIWIARKLDTLLPNNRKIVQILDSNKHHVRGDIHATSLKFKMHVAGFEGNQYERVEYYPLFPKEFQAAIEDMAK